MGFFDVLKEKVIGKPVQVQNFDWGAVPPPLKGGVLSDFINRLRGGFTEMEGANHVQRMMDKVKEDAIADKFFATPTHTPTPTPTPQFRVPMAQNYLAQRGRALKPDEIISGLNIASQKYNVPTNIMGDIMALESQLGTWDRPFDPKDQPGKYAGEQHARGPAMFLRSTAKGLGNRPEDRYSATESAKMLARKLKAGKLGEWDVSDMPGAGGYKMTDLYSEEELKPYSFASMNRRLMLQQLAKAKELERQRALARSIK